MTSPAAPQEAATAEIRLGSSRGALVGDVFTDMGLFNGQGPEPLALNIDGSVAMSKTLVRHADGTGSYFALRWTPFEGMRHIAPDYFYSWPNDMSDDGSVVVGFVLVNGQTQAMRWTHRDGVQLLAGPRSDASVISADGNVIAGTYNNAGWVRGFRWSTAFGFQDLGSVVNAHFRIYATSFDGNTIIGDLSGRPFRWTPSAGIEYLPIGPAEVRYVSATGAVMAGTAYLADGSQRAFRLQNGKQEILGTLGGRNSIPTGMDDHGNVITGYSLNAAGQERAFVWTAERGMQDLGSLGAATHHRATAISGNGDVIVGSALEVSRWVPFYWTAGEGIRALAMPDASSRLHSAPVISRDGMKTAVQVISSANVTSALLWTLDDDADNDGFLDDVDNCPNIPNDQRDADFDGVGDECDPTPFPDTDGDGVIDPHDNCVTDPNPSQQDDDQDGLGNECDPVEPGETRIGTSVSVQAVDPSGAPAPVFLTFSTVSKPGITTVSTGAPLAALPSNVRAGVPARAYVLSTTATVSGTIKFCVNYDAAAFPGSYAIQVLQLSPKSGEWVEATYFVDTALRLACTLLDAFVPVAVVQVNQVPEIVVIKSPVDPVHVGAEAQIAVEFLDRDGDLVTDDRTFVDWGDGSRSSGAALNLSGTSTGSTVIIASHPYASAGTFDVVINLTDAFHAVVRRTVSVTTINPDPGATPPGSDVTVTPVDPVTGTTPVSLSFGDVTGGGTTTVTTSGTGTPPASGFRLGNPPVYYDIHTTATFNGTATVCINYGDGFRNESQLKLLHREASGDWVDVTTSLDVDANIVCGAVTSFSPFTVAEANRAPAISSVSIPLDPQPVSSSVAVSADFTDADVGDTHVGSGTTIEWGDGTSSAGAQLSVTEPSAGAPGRVSGSHVYSTPGVYTVTVRVADAVGGVATMVARYVVVYDASGGFVTGGGWINSPAGALAASQAMTGRATFGFVARYQNGASTPSGKTEFQFKAGNLNFASRSYDWLVVAGTRAQFKGEGTINGAGSYRFMLTAIDADGGADAFRIRIWDAATGAVVYDNKMGAADDAPDATLLGGGSIVIHR